MIGSDERRHLIEGVAAGEEPAVGTVSFVAACAGDAAAVLERCREVMLAVVERQAGAWPVLNEWQRVLPAWFVDACAKPMSREEADRWLAEWQSLPPEQQEAIERRQAWSLEGWLHWLQPDERQWFWWDAAIESPDRLLVVVEVAGWPAPFDALVWLVRAAGAVEVAEHAST